MAQQQPRYRAFLSYSRRDRKAAIRLHRALEKYKLPRGTEGVRRRKLGRFFRDDDEMSASPDLGGALRGALEDSESLLVVCSPAAAKSRWVNEEIIHFKRLGRQGAIFAVIVDGTPNAPNETEECFPPALRFVVAPDGRVTDQPTEPLGLDLRQEPFARLRARLAAGLLGVPFDSLWRRDRRRARRRLAVTSLFTLAILSGFLVLGLGWLRSREQGRQQEIDQALAQTTIDVGEGRVTQGLLRLKPYLAEPIEPRVASASRSILGWARPLSEQVAAISPPRLLSYRGSLLFLDAERGIHDLSDLGVVPKRVLLSRDGRRLVVIGDFATIVLDPQAGSRLAERKNEGIEWESYAFETPSGLLVVLGTKYGSTNGTIFHDALSVSADGRTLTFRYLAHFVPFEGLWALGRCQGLLVAQGGERMAHPLSAQAIEEPQPVAASAAVGSKTAIRGSPGRTEANPFTVAMGSWALANSHPFEAAGCLTTGADSGAVDFDPSIAAVVPLGAQRLAPVEEWQELDEIPTLYRALPLPPGEDADSLPRVWDQARFQGRGFWRSLPVPRGVAPEETTFDGIEGTALAYLEDHANSGVTWRLCPTEASALECFQLAVLHDERRSYEALRSPDGRYLLIAQAGQIVDLSTLEAVTARDEVPTGFGSAFDFDPGSTQLTVAVAGELLAYRPVADGAWRRAEETSLASLGQKRDRDEATAGYTGLLALADGSTIVSQRDGLVTRFDPQGRKAWQLSASGLGAVLGLRYSADRRFFVLVGVRGLRLFESASGLALSGVLAPRGWSSDETEATDCVAGVTVDDEARLRVICRSWDDDAPRAATWAPRLFTGDLAARVEAIACDAAPGLSATAALRGCLDTPAEVRR
ncbi:MAG: toll/interleukin-1 receptor domain-containing protein [Acidobacteriota bacterium]